MDPLIGPFLHYRYIQYLLSLIDLKIKIFTRSLCASFLFSNNWDNRVRPVLINRMVPGWQYR